MTNTHQNLEECEYPGDDWFIGPPEGQDGPCPYKTCIEPVYKTVDPGCLSTI